MRSKLNKFSFWEILPFLVFSILFSSTLYSFQEYPFFNFIFASGLNLILYYFYSIISIFLVSVIKSRIGYTLLIGILFNIPIWISFLSVSSKILWGQFINLAILSDLIRSVGDFVNQLPLPFPIIAIGLVVLEILIFGYFWKIYVLKNKSIFQLKKFALLNIMIIGLILSAAINKKVKMAYKNHFTMSDHLSAFWLNSLGGGIKVNNDVISKSNISEYNLKYSKSSFKHTSQQNVFLIVVDALRADKIGQIRQGKSLTPVLDSLILNSDAAVVKSVFSTCGNSACGIMSLLSSKEWEELGLFNYLLQDHLKRANYKIHFFLSGLHSSWYNIGKQYMSNVDVYLESKDFKEYSLNDDYMLLDALDLYLPKTDSKNFFYLHMMGVHFFGNKKEEFLKFRPYKYNLLDKKPEIQQAYLNNYDNGLLQTDYLIGEIFDKIKNAEFGEEPIIIITSDHGEMLGEENRTGHTGSLHKKEIEIPLIIFGLKNKNIKRNILHTAQIDIAPSIATYLGMEMPEPWQGKSLFNTVISNTSFHHESNYSAAIYSDKNSMIKIELDNRDQKFRFFDIQGRQTVVDSATLNIPNLEFIKHKIKSNSHIPSN